MGKILIVDDDVSIAGLISDVLEDEGYETVVKTDGKSAYEYIMLNSNDISLITLDIMMPELSGIEICKFVRNITMLHILTFLVYCDNLKKQN